MARPGSIDIVGTAIVLNDTTFTVVGVTPPGFHGPQSLIALDVFIPVTMQATLIPGDRLAARPGEDVTPRVADDDLDGRAGARGPSWAR